MRVCIHHLFHAGVVLLLAAAASAAEAKPGDGIRIGSWVFSPHVEAVFCHDSNVYKDKTNVIEDLFFEPELGLRFSSSSETNRLSIQGNLFYSDRQYDTETNRDFKTYGDNITLRWGNDRKTLLELIQSYRLIDDNDRHASDFESSPLSAELIQDSNTLDLEREVHQFGASVARRFTDKLQLAISYRYSGVDYENETHDRLDPKQLGVPRGLDLEGHVWQFDGALGLTDKTDAFLTLRQGLQYQEDTDGAANLTTIRLGLKSQGSDKLVYNVGGGLERYERPGETKPVEGVERYELVLEERNTSRVSFNFSTALDWFITEKLTFRCGGYNGTQFSSFYQGNGMEYISGWAGLGYRWKPSTIFSVRGIYREDDYLDPVTHQGITVDRFDKRFNGRARIDYLAPGGFLRLYLEGTYDEVQSNLDFVEYVDKRLMIGAQLRY
jgi:hypothetical protein